MKPATQAPVHCVLYSELAEIAREHGYALAVHGSLARDFDLVCIPWASSAEEPQRVVDAIVSTFAFEQNGEPATREHGRLVYSLLGRGGWCGHLDVSFMPRVVDHSWCCKNCGCADADPSCNVDQVCGDCLEFGGDET